MRLKAAVYDELDERESAEQRFALMLARPKNVHDAIHCRVPLRLKRLLLLIPSRDGPVLLSVHLAKPPDMLRPGNLVKQQS